MVAIYKKVRQFKAALIDKWYLIIFKKIPSINYHIKTIHLPVSVFCYKGKFALR
jgi:hypothetical protein